MLLPPSHRLHGPVTPDSPLWVWAYESIGARAEEMLRPIEAVRLGEDIEAVHDMRVASRRLVAAMRVFEASFPGREFRRLLGEARSVTRRLGEVRDLEVQIDYYRRLREDGVLERDGIDYILALKRDAWERARKPMLAALDRLAASRYPERLRRYLTREAEAYAVGLDAASIHGAGVGEGAVTGRTPFREAAPRLLLARYRAFYELAPWVRQPTADVELHEMRIRAKWFRYTMELFAPAYADELRGPIAVVKRFQELLGELHDSDVRRELLDRMLDRPLEAGGLMALGLWLPDPVVRALRRLRVGEEATRRACYEAFRKEWRRQSRRGFEEQCRARIAVADALPGPGTYP